MLGWFVLVAAQTATVSLSPANQEVLMWLKRLQEEIGSEVTNEKLKEFIWDTLNSGQVGGRG